MKSLETVSWGAEAFDNLSGGLPAHLFSVVETPDYHSGNIVLGKFLFDGLRRGEQCVLVTFDSAGTYLANFLNWELDFEKYLRSGQFIFLNYQPNIGYEIGLTHDYTGLMSEIRHLCGGALPSRVGFQQVDALTNLNSPFLMNASVQKMAAAALLEAESGPTLLGQFVNFRDSTHHDLSIVFQKTVHGYFSLVQPDPLAPSLHTFQAKKVPWFNFIRQPVPVTLIEGVGFQSETNQRRQVG